jgi:hypothetical protein
MIRAMGGQLKIESVFPPGQGEDQSVPASSRKPLGRIEGSAPLKPENGLNEPPGAGELVVPTFTKDVKVGQPPRARWRSINSASSRKAPGQIELARLNCPSLRKERGRLGHPPPAFTKRKRGPAPENSTTD